MDNIQANNPESKNENINRNDIILNSDFYNNSIEITWEGESIWRGYRDNLECSYEAEIIIKPSKSDVLENNIKKITEDHAAFSIGDICNCFSQSLINYLDFEFNDFCANSAFSQPDPDDFPIKYNVSSWCSENGFEMVSCNGDGDADCVPDAEKAHKRRMQRIGWL